MGYIEHQSYLKRLEHVPREWFVPLTEVVDTVELVKRGLQANDIDPDPALVLGLTKLVLERHDHQASTKDTVL